MFNFVIPEFHIGGEGVPTFQFYRKGFNLGGSGSQPSWRDVILSGNTALTLVNAKEDGLNYLKLFGGTELLPETYLDTVTLSGGCEQRNLPVGFTQVESITFDDSSYIDTGIKANSAYTYKFKVKRTSPYNSNIWGVKTNSSYSVDSCIMLGWTGTSDVGIYSHEGYGTGGNAQVVSWGEDYHTIEFNPTSKKLIIDGVDRWSALECGCLTNDSWSSDIYNLYLGGTNTVGSFVGDGVSTWAEYEVWNGGVLIQRLINCKNSSNVLGMYDTVTGDFLTNQGTGTLTAGADVTTPTPDYPMDIVCNNGVLKLNNVHNIATDTLGGYINKSTGEIASNNGYGYTDYIPVTAGQVLKIAQRGSSTTDADGIAEYDLNKVWQSSQSINALGGTYTVPSGISYIRPNFNINYQQFVIENGIYVDGTQEVVTDSLGNTATAERLLAVGDYKDTQEVISGSVTRQIGITILDGTEGWIKSGTYAGSFYTNTYNPLDGAKVANISNVYCTHGFKVNDLGEYSTASIGAFYWYSSGTINYKYDDGTATVEQFKQWLADQYANGTPVIVAYPLATATTESVSGQFLSKSPVTQTEGSISNLPIAITESSHTTPTPSQPLQINCNNGVLKARINLVNTANSTKGQYITSQGTIQSSTNWATSDYLPVIAGDKVTVSGLTYSSSAAGFNYYDASKNKVSTIPYETGTHTYTVPNNASYIMITYRWLDDESTVKVYVGETLNAPYTDGTVETVEIHTKNLFDYEYFYDNYQDYGTSAVGRCLIQLKPNTAYTISTNKNSSLGNSVMFVVSGSAIDWTPSTTGNGILAESPRTVTTDSNGYLCFGIYVEGENAIPESDFINGTVWAQIELGSTATTYEPYYYGGSATAEMLLKVGTYQDEQSVIDGGVTRNVGVMVLDGTEDWIAFGSLGTNTYTLNIPDAKGQSNWSTRGAYVTHFNYWISATIPTTANTPYNTMWFNSSKDLRTKVSTDIATTVAELTQWLQDQCNAGTPVIIVYPKSSPTTETVTGQELTIQEGTNIVEITQASIDNLELEVSYKAGVAVTITEVQNAQLDNNVEVTING